MQTGERHQPTKATGIVAPEILARRHGLRLKGY